jgi:hypothetical protein
MAYKYALSNCMFVQVQLFFATTGETLEDERKTGTAKELSFSFQNKKS